MAAAVKKDNVTLKLMYYVTAVNDLDSRPWSDTAQTEPSVCVLLKPSHVI